MGGSTMIMAPAVESSTSFPRSHSNPELLSLSPVDKSSASSPNHPQRHSLSSLPSLDLPSFNIDFQLDISTIFSGEEVGKSAPDSLPSIVRTEEMPGEAPRATPARARTASLAEVPRDWFSSSNCLTNARDEEPPRPTTSAGDRTFGGDSIAGGDLKPLGKSLTTSQTFASFAKRSWRSSRSPSPSPSPSPTVKPDAPKEKLFSRSRSESTTSLRLTKTRKRSGLTADQAEKNNSSDSLKLTPTAFSRASSYFSKIKQKPAAPSKLNTKFDSDNSCASSSTSLAPPASTSTDGRTPQTSSCDVNATVTDESSIEMPPQNRDVLWPTFRTLDAEFKSFPAKSTAQRMSQIQSLLLPFLRNTMNHPSTKQLYPEDVDRRAAVLNKWWIVILEMLEGHAPQPVPGVDRPALYDTATLLMMRLEWRQTTSYFLPLADRSPDERVRSRPWTTSSNSSMTSSQAAFVEESAEHNIRTMFVSNLVKQMAFVVEKLSLRHAPMSLVNFAGKACAYAFFFAPGIADVLTRLWGLSPELIRRIADELGLPRRNRGESDDIAALFPPSMGLFGWTSPKGMWDSLKSVPRLPMLISQIPWTGPWVARWKGRDSDLFFIFCKYFHILCEQFMPPGLPLIEKARSPAFALVHAQLLFVLDSTVHRQSSTAGYGPSLLDSMHGADAALTVPLPPSNVMKGMSENRLIMLLKDFLSDDSIEISHARHTFAEAFAAIMKASTRRTSQYNHAACFTLCDFLEEVLILHSEFEEPEGTVSYIDWPFWFDVCKRILDSCNTMSEVRMLSLIFALWDAISKDPVRKLSVCKDWLLAEETFNTFFNHWCPMVRAYYQRLLCWRMCRDGGELDEVDGQIFVLVAERLKTTWSHYLHLKHTAEIEKRIPHSTAPVLPAPGKRFMIIRQEVSVPQPGLFMGFDTSTKFSNPDNTAGSGINNEIPRGDSKKRWSLLGKVLSLGGGGQGGGGWDDDIQPTRREGAGARTPLGAVSANRAKMPLFNANNTRFADDNDSLYSQPTYEEQKYVFKFILGWQHQAAPHRDRSLARPQLPAPAESRISGPISFGDPHSPNGVSVSARKFSGSPGPGLINGARNASPLSSPIDDKPQQLALNFPTSPNLRTKLSLSDLSDRPTSPISRRDSPAFSDSAVEDRGDKNGYLEGVVEPVKPTGCYTKTAIYAGRALAEWAQVVFECNNFVERRRDEGIDELRDVEIPILGVDGFRKMSG